MQPVIDLSRQIPALVSYKSRSSRAIKPGTAAAAGWESDEIGGVQASPRPS